MKKKYISTVVGFFLGLFPIVTANPAIEGFLSGFTYEHRNLVEFIILDGGIFSVVIESAKEGKVEKELTKEELRNILEELLEEIELYAFNNIIVERDGNIRMKPREYNTCYHPNNTTTVTVVGHPKSFPEGMEVQFNIHEDVVRISIISIIVTKIAKRSRKGQGDKKVKKTTTLDKLAPRHVDKKFIDQFIQPVAGGDATRWRS